MNTATGIEWTDASWNPTRGCSRVSAGCKNCYAERFAERFCGPGRPYHGLVRIRADGRPDGWSGDVRTVPERLADPLRLRAPSRIFVNSMSDLFHEDVPREYVAAVFGVMAATPLNTYQILTKRAGRMRSVLEWLGSADICALTCAALDEAGFERGCGSAFDVDEWPLPNVWLGVSAEDQRSLDERVPELLATDATLRWVSAEPLLEGLRFREEWMLGQFSGCADEDAGDVGPRVGWVVAGCESGPGARACDVDWLRSLRDQCEVFGTPFFLKQAAGVRGLEDADVVSVTTGPGSRRKPGGIVGSPYLDGVQHLAVP